jgi:hypothetical protein
VIRYTRIALLVAPVLLSCAEPVPQVSAPSTAGNVRPAHSSVPIASVATTEVVPDSTSAPLPSETIQSEIGDAGTEPDVAPPLEPVPPQKVEACGPGGSGRVVQPARVGVDGRHEGGLIYYDPGELTFMLAPDGCWPSGSTIMREARCEVRMLDDRTIEVSGRFCIERRRQRSHLADCSGAEPASCRGPHLEPGTYKVVSGNLSTELTIPSVFDYRGNRVR